MDRVKATCDLDISTARIMTKDSDDYSDQEILAGLHKARVSLAGVFSEVTEEMAAESKQFLSNIGIY